MNTSIRLAILGPYLAFTLQASLHAQTSLTLPATGTAGSGSSAVDFEFRLDGSIYAKGSLGSSTTLSSSDLQASSRFLWLPALSALRAGSGSTSESLATVGGNSVAFGYNCLASSGGSFAAGLYSTASGQGSVALGQNATASGMNAIAFGSFLSATGWGASAIGQGVSATGGNSLAMGQGSSASGMNSTAFGYVASASGDFSISAGYFTAANSYNDFAVGRYNTGLSESGAAPSATSWTSASGSADPLFEVGNGASSGAKADAMVVYKNGDMAAHGKIRCAAGGDISMGSFTAGTAP